MALKATPFALPQLELHKSDSCAVSSSAMHEGGPTLVIIGHMNCKTTRQTLPFIDRIRKDGGRALAMLQDSPEDAAAGLAALRGVQARPPGHDASANDGRAKIRGRVVDHPSGRDAIFVHDAARAHEIGNRRHA
jgi:hypothetical protein